MPGFIEETAWFTIYLEDWSGEQAVHIN